MKRSFSILSLVLVVSLFSFSSLLKAQEPVSWLSDFTGDVADGSSTLKYSFYPVDGNPCKMSVEETKTDKKGNVSTSSWVFYLSDLDPSAMSFKPSGKTIDVSLGIKNSQKFITVSEDGEFTGYTDEVVLTMSEVDKARAFLDVLKSHAGDCKQNDRAWTSREEAFDWLSKNIVASDNSGTSYEQSFSQGEKPYMAVLKTEWTDSKGSRNSVVRTFDLSDLNPSGISLNVSGKSLNVELPVRDRNYFIVEKNGEGEITFGRDMDVYTDDIEAARNSVNAFVYLVNNTKAERPGWTGYEQALTFVKDNTGEVTSSGKVYAQNLDFEPSSSGTVTFTSEVTDSRGTSDPEKSIFYPEDIQLPVTLDVSSRTAKLQVEAKDRNKYIKQYSGNSQESWAYSFDIYVDDIDLARNLAAALDVACKNSTKGDPGLTSIEKTSSWLAEHVKEVKVDDQSIKQTMKVLPDRENKIELQVYTTDNGGTNINEEYEIYPEDLSAEDNMIKVSGKKLYVPLSTGKINYIRAHKDGSLQSYTRSIDVVFDDVQQAKYFTTAVDFLIKNSGVKNRGMANAGAAWDYLVAHVSQVEVDGDVYDQSLERPDESNPCKLKYTNSATDSKGTTTEYTWEFMITDIDPAASGISVSSDEIHVNLVTKGREKLIKPYKNGEAENFDYDLEIQANDILEAKKLLAAFKSLAEHCE
ncbi:MAG TPA: hypothetical protein VE870_07255 [Bacteroidales bacterium]|nr:hypothetical protein [Bacteroidales bacterium]